MHKKTINGLVFLLLLNFSCVYVPKGPEVRKTFLENKLSPCRVSVNFYIENISPKDPNKVESITRDENFEKNREILELIKKEISYCEVMTDYDDYRGKSTFVLDIFSKTHRNGGLGNFLGAEGIFLTGIFPIPLNYATEYKWNLKNRNGVIVNLSDRVEYSKYAFFGFAPVGVYQTFTRPLEKRLQESKRKLVFLLHENLVKY
jgi:hypothetical protein